MSTRVCTALFFSLLLTASLFGQASVVHVNETVEFDFQITACTGEIVTFLGEAHFIQHSTGTPAEGGSTFFHVNFHLEGVSPSGTRYVVNEAVNVPATSAADGATTFTSEGTLVGVSQGNEDNLLLHTVIRFTVNSTGEIVGEHFSFETRCQG